MRSILAQYLARRCSLPAGFVPACEPGGWDEQAWLDRFRPVWREIRRVVPAWQSESWPSDITSYAAFCELPFQRRESLQSVPVAFCSNDMTGTEMASTGGSTGRPLTFPLYQSELEVGRCHQNYARRAYGIEPGDRSLLIWGHSSHMDDNWRARLVESVRALKDWGLGYRRLSAYRLTSEILRFEFSAMVRFRPAWIYAYSSSLLAFVRANADRGEEARMLRLKACIGAAEPMSPDMREEISRFFECPVGMEYGSVEMRVCAHTHPSFPGYYVYTPHHLLEAIPTAQAGVYDLAVTKVFRSAMPLVRYLVGDQVIVRDPFFRGGPLTWFDDVQGRMNDNLRLPDGSEVHSETVTHAIRAESEVLSYQLHQRGQELTLRLSLRRGANLSGMDERIRSRLARVHADFQLLRFEQVEDVLTTSAGKRRWVIRETLPS
jgi:phenylacetate-CoA ligase